MKLETRSTNPDYLRRLEPNWTEAKNEEKSQRLADLRFRYALALAFSRGDHLPAGQIPVLRLIG